MIKLKIQTRIRFTELVQLQHAFRPIKKNFSWQKEKKNSVGVRIEINISVAVNSYNRFTLLQPNNSLSNISVVN